MITAIFLSKQDNLIGFEVFGHADFSKFDLDLVCACVSSAVQMACNTITECFKSNAKVSIDDNQGISLKLIDCSKNNPSIKVIDGLKLHLVTLEEDFPKNIKVKVMEV